jgi:hypothetical protein
MTNQKAILVTTGPCLFISLSQAFEAGDFTKSEPPFLITNSILQRLCGPRRTELMNSCRLHLTRSGRDLEMHSDCHENCVTEIFVTSVDRGPVGDGVLPETVRSGAIPN